MFPTTVLNSCRKQFLCPKTVFVGFVAFGVTALIALVCELTIDANASQGEDPKWYIHATFFVAVWLILMIDRVVPN